MNPSKVDLKNSLNTLQSKKKSLLNKKKKIIKEINAIKIQEKELRNELKMKASALCLYYTSLLLKESFNNVNFKKVYKTNVFFSLEYFCRVYKMFFICYIL